MIQTHIHCVHICVGILPHVRVLYLHSNHSPVLSEDPAVALCERGSTQWVLVQLREYLMN